MYSRLCRATLVCGLATLGIPLEAIRHPRFTRIPKTTLCLWPKWSATRVYLPIGLCKGDCTRPPMAISWRPFPKRRSILRHEAKSTRQSKIWYTLRPCAWQGQEASDQRKKDNVEKGMKQWLEWRTRFGWITVTGPTTLRIRFDLSILGNRQQHQWNRFRKADSLHVV